MNEIELGRVISCLRFCNISIKEFAENTGLKTGTLYQIVRGQKTSKRMYDYIIACLEIDYSEEYEKIKKIIKEVG